MAKFRKKPVEVEAIQFVEVARTCSAHGTSVEYNDSKIATFMNKILTRCTAREKGNPAGRTYLEIPTLEGVMQANVGDWIIKGVNGEFYPCKPDIFAKTYDAAIEDTLQPHQQRVVDEKAELDERREKLGAFKNSAMFQSLPWQEQERLNTQAHLMTMLSGVLGERIANF